VYLFADFMTKEDQSDWFFRDPLGKSNKGEAVMISHMDTDQIRSVTVPAVCCDGRLSH
jgi:hypothetical protein